MNFLVMRHGQTDYNRQHLLQGRRDIPLSTTGLEQARQAAEEIRRLGISFTHVCSSPLSRAVQTASVVSGFPSDEIQKEDRLLEINFGPLEGKKVEDLDDNMRNFFNQPDAYCPPEGAESYESVLARMQSLLTDMSQVQEEGTTLLLSHGAALHAMYMLVTGITLPHYWDKAIGNCGWFEICQEDGTWKILRESMHAEAWTLPAGSFLNGEEKQHL